MTRILVDADACPVKDETYRVALRHDVPVTLVANSYLRTPATPLITSVMVSDGFDAADDWIAETAGPDCIVITSDILLAGRVLEAGAAVLAPTGKPWTTANIGSAIATRAIMADLRGGIEQGAATGGPPPFRKEDRSNYLQALDREVVRLKRADQ